MQYTGDEEAESNGRPGGEIRHFPSDKSKMLERASWNANPSDEVPANWIEISLNNMNNQAAPRPCYSAVLGYTGNTNKNSCFFSPNAKTNSKLFFITRVSNWKVIQFIYTQELRTISSCDLPLTPLFFILLSARLLYSISPPPFLPFNIYSPKRVTSRAWPSEWTERIPSASKPGARQLRWRSKWKRTESETQWYAWRKRTNTWI